MNFIYTYVPKDDDKKLDSEFYLIDVILLVLSVSKIKRFKESEDKIIFYSTKQFYNYIEPLNLFDEFNEVPNILKYIEKQEYDFCHKNCIYKIFVSIQQNEPFITLDHDFIVYKKDYLDKIKKKDLVFAFQEFLYEPAYDNTYLPTYNKVIDMLGNNQDILKNIKTDYSINVSVLGGKRLDIIKNSYINITNFYIQNIEKLNTIPLMTMFLEQFLFRSQIENFKVNPYYCWEDIKQGKCHHFTGFRYDLDNRKRIVNELIEENPQAYKYILTEFGFFPDYMIKITDS
jgi:hypothetical protein